MAKIKFFLVITMPFLLIYNTNNGQETMTDSNCLTKENFSLVLTHIQKNGVDKTQDETITKTLLINEWNLIYIKDKERNRIAFSKPDKGWTLGFVLNEKDSIRVIATVIKNKKHNEFKKEIQNTFCEIVKVIKKDK